jgi:hypothetical protein
MNFDGELRSARAVAASGQRAAAGARSARQRERSEVAKVATQAVQALSSLRADTVVQVEPAGPFTRGKRYHTLDQRRYRVVDEQRCWTQLVTVLADAVADLDSADARVVRTWLAWQVYPRLRRRADQGADLTHSITNARAATIRAIAFLTDLRRAGRSLARCTQTDLNHHFAAGPAAFAVRPFLAWAQRRRHLPAGLHLPTYRPGTPDRPFDSEQRWIIARRLITDTALDPADRVAGALVVLYAQPLSRIVRLTIDVVQIINGQVHLTIGADPLELAEPFAALIRALPRPRRGGVADQIVGPWLFPSLHAGQHLTATALGRRLQRLGIHPRAVRRAALSQLAVEIPPGILAGVIGIHPQTAVRAAATGGGDYARYAASRNRDAGPRTSP